MAIKSFDKSKLKSVGLLEQSTGQVTATGCCGEFVEDDDTAAPPRSKLMQRRHTVTVPLPAEGDSDSGSASPDEPGLPQARDCQGSASRHWQGLSIGGWGWGSFLVWISVAPHCVSGVGDIHTPRFRAGTGSAAQLECWLLCSCWRWPHSQISPDLTNRDVTRWRQQNYFPILFSAY